MKQQDKVFLSELAEELNAQDDDGSVSVGTIWCIVDKKMVLKSETNGNFKVVVCPKFAMPLEEFVESEYIDYKDTGALKEDAKKCLCMCTDTDDLIDALETFVSRYPCGCSMGYASMEEHICEEATVFLTKKSAEEYLKLNKHNFTKEARVYALSVWRNPVYEKLINIIKTTNWEEV